MSAVKDVTQILCSAIVIEHVIAYYSSCQWQELESRVC